MTEKLSEANRVIGRPMTVFDCGYCGERNEIEGDAMFELAVCQECGVLNDVVESE